MLLLHDVEWLRVVPLLLLVGYVLRALYICTEHMTACMLP